MSEILSHMRQRLVALLDRKWVNSSTTLDIPVGALARQNLFERQRHATADRRNSIAELLHVSEATCLSGRCLRGAR